MNSIRVKSKSEYVIEVNDNGETISFDLEDTELMLKFNRAVDRIHNIQKYIEEKEKELQEKEDKKTDGILTANEIEIMEITNQAFNDMRIAFDEFLGKGACHKIFGDKNYMTMFEDLIEELEPHFEKMGMNARRFEKEIQEKYQNEDETVL